MDRFDKNRRQKVSSSIPGTNLGQICIHLKCHKTFHNSANMTKMSCQQNEKKVGHAQQMLVFDWDERHAQGAQLEHACERYFLFRTIFVTSYGAIPSGFSERFTSKIEKRSCCVDMRIGVWMDGWMDGWIGRWMVDGWVVILHPLRFFSFPWIIKNNKCWLQKCDFKNYIVTPLR